VVTGVQTCALPICIFTYLEKFDQYLTIISTSCIAYLLTIISTSCSVYLLTIISTSCIAYLLIIISTSCSVYLLIIISTSFALTDTTVPSHHRVTSTGDNRYNCALPCHAGMNKNSHVNTNNTN